MRDDILYGNLLGLLKTGKWTVNIAEAAALIQIYQEVEIRSRPPKVTDENLDKKPKTSKGINANK